MLSQRDLDLLKLEAELQAEDMVQEFEAYWQGNRGQPMMPMMPMPQEQPMPMQQMPVEQTQPEMPVGGPDGVYGA